MHYQAAPRAERHKQRKWWRDEARRAMRPERGGSADARRHALERQQARMEAVLAG